MCHLSSHPAFVGVVLLNLQFFVQSYCLPFIFFSFDHFIYCPVIRQGKRLNLQGLCLFSVKILILHETKSYYIFNVKCLYFFRFYQTVLLYFESQMVASHTDIHKSECISKFTDGGGYQVWYTIWGHSHHAYNLTLARSLVS